MCGLCGLFDPAGGLGPGTRPALDAMIETMARRGPDDAGAWSDSRGHVQLGFRRLSILDLSTAASQPMVSASGRSVLVFNGEIYDFQQLARDLESAGVRLRTRGDTEVLLEGLERWGTDWLGRLDGMFALALYDRKERRLLLARDRFGIKPLYLFEPDESSSRPDDSVSAGRLAFGSQYDLLTRTPWGPPGAPRLAALHLYLRLGHLPAPHALLEGTRQLEPGTWTTVDAAGRRETRRWWRLPGTWGAAPAEPSIHDAEAALEAVDAALEASVSRRLVADVPVGTFLSGGVDSPLVAATARQAGRRGQGGATARAAFPAFTLAVPGWEQDESAAAAHLADRLDLEHHVLTLDEAAMVASVDAARSALHEPFADYSILPTLMLSRFARQHVKVALSGDGGDELFFGYERPRSLLRGAGLFRWPRALRLALYAAGRLGIGPARSDVIVHEAPGDYYFEVNSRFPADALARLAPGLPAALVPSAYDTPLARDAWTARELAEVSRHAEIGGQLQRGLKKVDMASMHESLEVRVPLLGREVVAASLAIDPLLSLGGGERKAVLRAALARRAGADALQQRKLGFGVPLGQWLRGPLRRIAEETLLDRALWPHGLFERSAVEAFWREHLDGRANHKWALWALLSLQWWHQRVEDAL